jgi:hypothetical protein
MCSDTEISECNLYNTKIEVVASNVLASHSGAMEIQDLTEISHLGVSTDDSNRGSLELLSVVIQHFH